MSDASVTAPAAGVFGSIPLGNGSPVAIVGGGPAGSLCGYFLLEFAARAGLDLRVDIFEPRDFNALAPGGCNMCGGIVSESLLQALAVEGIVLPPRIVQRGIDSYVLHLDAGSVRIATPLEEKRIAAVYRGGGPRDLAERGDFSFDAYLLDMAVEKGATVVRGRVDDIGLVDGRPLVRSRAAEPKVYDLVVVATGVNPGAGKLFREWRPEYQPPKTTKTFIREYRLGAETIRRYLGSSMHVFMLDHPGVEFAALIPKGDHATLCLLGDDVNAGLVNSFVNAPGFKNCMPPGWRGEEPACQCGPRMNVGAARTPFGDRIVFLGDCGVTRLYKDGIGGAYRAAKAVARAAVFHGVSAAEFERHYWPTCRQMALDNEIGKVIFDATHFIQRVRLAREAVYRMAAREQRASGGRRNYMSLVLWDTFTGSASYREILLRSFHPNFWLPLTLHVLASLLAGRRSGQAPRGEA
jgi:flavin-dependent dehydrogenase